MSTPPVSAMASAHPFLDKCAQLATRFEHLQSVVSHYSSFPAAKSDPIAKYRKETAVRTSIPSFRAVLINTSDESAYEYEGAEVQTKDDLDSESTPWAPRCSCQRDCPYRFAEDESRRFTGFLKENGRGTEQTPNVLLVEGLCPEVIEILGERFRLSPEFFAEHLNRSGYGTSKADERDSTQWSTRIFKKQYFSARWVKPVYTTFEQRLFQNADPEKAVNFTRGVKSRFTFEGEGPVPSVYVQDYEKASQICRRSVSFSALPHGDLKPQKQPFSHGLYPKIEDEASTAFLCGWDQRISICSRAQRHGIIIVLVDPMPKGNMEMLVTTKESKSVKLLGVEGQTFTQGPSEKLHRTINLYNTIEPYVPFCNERDIELELDAEELMDIADCLSDESASSTLQNLHEWIIDYIQTGSLQSSNSGLGNALETLCIGMTLHMVHSDLSAFLQRLRAELASINSQMVDADMVEEKAIYWRSLFAAAQENLQSTQDSISRYLERIEKIFHPPDRGQRRKSSDTLVPVDPLIEQKLLEAQNSLTRTQQEITQTKLHISQLSTLLVAEIGIVESKHAIQEAESVRKLTELAFLFIPMSFVASFFSMQVREFADDRLSLSNFYWLTAILLCFTYGARVVVQSRTATRWYDSACNRMKLDYGLPRSKQLPSSIPFKWPIMRLFAMWKRPNLRDMAVRTVCFVKANTGSIIMFGLLVVIAMALLLMLPFAVMPQGENEALKNVFDARQSAAPSLDVFSRR